MPRSASCAHGSRSPSSENYTAMGDFLRAQFDKLLLASLLALMLSVLLHLLHARPQNDYAAAVGWLEKSIDMITGSLLTLVTGHLLRPPEK